MQTLVTQHVQLFERLLYVERDISSATNIRRVRGNLSEGLLRRHPSHMKVGMLVDRHKAAIDRARKETQTVDSVQTVEFRQGTQVKGDAAAIQKMVEKLSCNIFDEFLANRDAVLSHLDRVPYVVRCFAYRVSVDCLFSAVRAVFTHTVTHAACSSSCLF